MAGRLTSQVVAICDEALGRLQPGEARTMIEGVRAKLVEPLRVAVAGSVSSGKSTLVNAFLGQKIAAVDAGECTRVVTWFRYDPYERIEVVLRDGGTKTVQFLPGHRMPESFGVPVEQIGRVVVYLSNEALRNAAIIDTPGLNTVTAENQAATADFLGLADGSKESVDSRSAMTQADALVFLMPHVRTTDADVLTQFRSLFGGSDLSAVNAVGVLSKIDKLVADGDPWPTARRLAERAREELGDLVATVIPVNGLLAETANCDQFTEADAAALRQLASLDEMDLEDMVLSQTDFLDSDLSELSREQRHRLLGRLDLRGIQVGVQLVQQGVVGAAALLPRFRTESGFDPLGQVVQDVFLRRSDALKAHVGLCDLRRLTYLRSDGLAADELMTMRAPLERVELDPGLHDLRIVDALNRAYRGDVFLPEALLGDLRRLALEPTAARRVGLGDAAIPSDVANAAAQRAQAWAVYENDFRRSPDERRLAGDVREGFELLWDQAASGVV
ncbi:MAG: dynamin family protein [Acidimicrobiales bacterium]|jgi:GTPase Era involved in 16S rRNA processing|nr:dynamin family protein [Acidimicrobiales bacterium]